MRATIVVDDNVMVIDGVAEHVDCSALLEQGVHAVQWHETMGEVEYRNEFDGQHITRRPNELIQDFSDYQVYVNAWKIEHAKTLREQEEQAKPKPSPEPPPEPKPMPLPVYNVYLDHENRIRKLEGKKPFTMAELYAEQKRLYDEAVAKAKKSKK